MRTCSRRAVLTGSVAAITTLVGCADDRADETPTRDTPTASATPSPETMPTETDGLDLREANVTAVEIEAEGGGSYRFEVTLYHDDDGEDGYANWWQVERLDGTRLGRRDLRHAHSTDPFMRPATIEIPDGVDCVVVRGHDQTHGYGGQAAIVTLGTGATRFVQQGSDGESFADADCP